MQVFSNYLDRESWNRFLRKQSHSHFWHTWEWGEFLTRFRGREILRFSVHDGKDEILGLTSVCLESFSPLGDRGDSIPVYHFSGPIVRDGLSPQNRTTLYEELVDFTDRELRKRRVLDLTIRVWDPSLDITSLDPWKNAGYHIEQGYTFMYAVPQDESQVPRSYGHNFRNQVKQSLDRGGRVEVNTSPDQDVYELYLMSMAQAGARPRYSQEEMNRVLGWSNDMRDVYTCKYGDKVIGFAVSLKFNRMATYWLAGIDRKFAALRPMNLIIDEFIRESVRHRMLMIDFGGAGTSRLAHFKQSIGAKPAPIFELGKIYCSNLYFRLALKLHGATESIGKSVHSLQKSRESSGKQGSM